LGNLPSETSAGLCDKKRPLPVLPANGSHRHSPASTEVCKKRGTFCKNQIGMQECSQKPACSAKKVLFKKFKTACFLQTHDLVRQMLFQASFLVS
jgi:hypothetical protein